MSNYNRNPFVEVKKSYPVYTGWEEIGNTLRHYVSERGKKKSIIVVEYYQGVLEEDITQALIENIKPDYHFSSKAVMRAEQAIMEMVAPDLTDDRIFGYLSRLTIDAYFDSQKVQQQKKVIEQQKEGIILITGPGAAYIAPSKDLLIYADMARWEIQLRMREHLVDNLGVSNRNTPDWMLLYKQGYFIDWRVCDRWKKKLMPHWDFVLDTNDRKCPKMVEQSAIQDGLEQCLSQPFSVVPFFDPGPWGGQWMKEKCNLDRSKENYAWCFNCVPEENSLLLKIDNRIIELPSINLVFYAPERLLGAPVHARFGDEFPIRFDFLDTMKGGNLSLQVHPLTEYIQEKFGMHYTQDESYYLMDADPGALVYLGLKEGIDPDAMIGDLEAAQRGEGDFVAERHVQTWEVKKHDHILIPAGTVHCSGESSMVLEISATPYIFTFKLWDWGRLGLDGKPRPINIEHGKNVIQWDRTTEWIRDNLVNQISIIAEGDGWREEKTGLHAREFIETRRHWFTKPVQHQNPYGVNVICLVEGDEIVVESPGGSFEPFCVHYAEVFIVPSSITEYIITPSGKSKGKKCATLKAFVRTNA
jgi:mannose-6-phosphate isomerase class I